MNILLISASHRVESESIRVTYFLEKLLKKDCPENLSTEILNLAKEELPFWDENFWPNGEIWKKTWPAVKKKIAEADAFVFVVPEWHGSVPSRFRNLLLLAGPQEMGNKPALIIAISAARGGAFPVLELRSTCGKNSRFFYIPEQLIVRDCKTMFQGETPASEDDRYLRERASYCLRLLTAYAQALAPIRKDFISSFKDFPNGMS